MNAKQALDYLEEVTMIEPTVTDEVAKEAVAVIRAYIDELWSLLDQALTAGLERHPKMESRVKQHKKLEGA